MSCAKSVATNGPVDMATAPVKPVSGVSGAEPSLRREEKWFPSAIPHVNLSVTKFVPALASPVGAILFCHGYGHYCALIYSWLAERLAEIGIQSFGIEHHGHGKSGGLRGYVPDFSAVVDDVLAYSATIRSTELPAGVPLFAYGESLGGGILLHAALRNPAAFAGLVLSAPMTGLAEGVAPPWIVQQIGKMAAWMMPTAAVAPVRDILPSVFKDPAMLPIARADPIRYDGRMRLGTAFQLKAAMEDLSLRGAQLAVPYLLLHGTGDLVTSHHASERLHDACGSRDKTLVLYDTAYHVLLCEPVDTRRRILDDIRAWLTDRTDAARRAALRAPIAAKLTRPAGGDVFLAPAADAHLNVYSWGSHGHTYTGTAPSGTIARPSHEAVAAALAAPQPLIPGAAPGAAAAAPAAGAGAAAAGEAAHAVGGAGAVPAAPAAPLPPVESAAAAHPAVPPHGCVEAIEARIEDAPTMVTAAEAAAPTSA